MLRIFFISLAVLFISYLAMQGFIDKGTAVMPVFLSTDNIALAHNTNVQTTVLSKHEPDSLQLQVLAKDYSNLWAHLNQLFATNNVELGKEYYTEDWFKQICHHTNGAQPNEITRHDAEHHLYIQNWSTDNLVCTAIDSNVVFITTYPDKSVDTTKSNLAVVLLYQGDHWRIDALRVLSQSQLD